MQQVLVLENTQTVSNVQTLDTELERMRDANKESEKEKRSIKSLSESPFPPSSQVTSRVDLLQAGLILVFSPQFYRLLFSVCHPTSFD